MIEVFHNHALRFAEEATAIIQQVKKAGFSNELKSDNSLVTEADVQSETRLRELIAEAFPEHGIIGEEFPPMNPDADYVWILDPVDGTEEFAHGLPLYGCMIALYERGEPIVGVVDQPELGVRLSAAKGLGAFRNSQLLPCLAEDSALPAGKERLGLASFWHFGTDPLGQKLFTSVVKSFPNIRIYSSCFIYTAMITGGLDVCLNWKLKPWDNSVAPLFAGEAGGKYISLPSVEDKEGDTLESGLFGRSAVVERIRPIVEEVLAAYS